MADRLRMDHINSLPQPFHAQFCGGPWWPIYDIDVQTGMMRIDVCGLLEVKHFGEVSALRDADGADHDPDTFYAEEASQ